MGRNTKERMPDLSHRQFFIVDLVGDDEHSGRYIRDRLNDHGIKTSLPAFYQMMARLEDAELIRGFYVTTPVKGHVLKERHYKSLAHGRKQCQVVLDFYKSRSPSRVPHMA
jgi:DNA-binding PadR family transcriptional regulator